MFNYKYPEPEYPEPEYTKYEKILITIANFFYDIAWYITSPVAAVLHGLVTGCKDAIQGAKDRLGE